ncbi:hypothetical protein A3G55_02585 [Candidatus Giovannonibacteria bacterium RIFCSPLOWO2_12_FULL_44_25]|uniref:Uncharacterized protein n=3 Tax=Candidatus Giovannoniibacteriota TaxID=1752738 RepID=A0A0G1LAL6_9BACT|nr:MAG: hypothetical protein UW15_C0015G0018 [Parcubacteria group bacterium GW2011_GWC1_44_10]KKT57039.1 MAG: hypothetical protein UW49_C0008G0001 [Candidatus Giovannonibacteria bacterium GW2011_GWB1_44_23]KKT59475.1 MAG: hypothetical protein UW53_C0011G0004 [Candidatus Giovannonibacteria bacterium GW2011_GWA1_44_25]OGF49925.1 MAG: hypothetical protein A2120_04410 [Candidatus Giovannonibacteria bacterium GWA2_45_15]OGF60559.1 MAG: hypothetical protein A2656_00570 [Candidatus Giovannonibacteria 
MRKFLFALILSICATAGPTFANQTTGEITFIASNAELQLALEKRLELKGLAVSSDFYAVIENGGKEKIDELAKFLLDKALRPVFIYGYKIDASVLYKWFGSHGEFGCKPLVMAGIFPTLLLNLLLNGNFLQGLQGATVEMCGGDEPVRSEEWLRNWVAESWRATKEDLKNKGYATLP